MASIVADIKDSLFLKACRREPTARPPIWLMRQAGRYMASYRQLRERYELLELVKNPELACEVTLQPIEQFGFDAAIIFADILPLLSCIGIDVQFAKGSGPILSRNLSSEQEVLDIKPRPVEECLAFTIKAVDITARALKSHGVPLIGFSGAPFTLASYAIDGTGHDHAVKTKAMMHASPKAFDHLMRVLCDLIGDYLLAQVKAGAHALQIFDSWAGVLSWQDYGKFVLPHQKALIKRVKENTSVPVIYFGTQTSGLLDLLSTLECDVIGVDWRIPIQAAWKQLGASKAIQGNLDPALLSGPWTGIEASSRLIFEQVKSLNAEMKGFVFNLGHGILPSAKEDNVKKLVEWVKATP